VNTEVLLLKLCRPSVLRHCWLGHVSVTRKTVSEITYNVSSGTLNSTIPYHVEAVLAIMSLAIWLYVITYSLFFFSITF